MGNGNGADIFIGLIVLGVIGITTAFFADRRGRSPIGWFFIGVFFGIFGLILLFLLPNLQKNFKEMPTPEESGIIPYETLHTKPPAEERKEHYEVLNWFYLDAQNNQHGPFTFQEFRNLWIEGVIHPLTYIWGEGMEDWKHLEAMPELRELLESKEG